jgi:glycosyltransferase involved in cell wall biosynthesis
VLSQITPVILTFNEENNIGRTLGQLTWAPEVVVVDSFSSDETLSIAATFANVRVVRREFDSHAAQWNFAIRESGITTSWILALDADYYVTAELRDELSRLEGGAEYAAYEAAFRWCEFGRVLRGSLYPPVTVLFRNGKGRYLQDGHTQRVHIDGTVGKLRSPMLHDDRKPLGHWLAAQDRYMTLECAELRSSSFSELRLADRIRKLLLLAPALTFFYCLVFKRGILDGWPGLHYALRRTVAESILSLKLVEALVQGKTRDIGT